MKLLPLAALLLLVMGTCAGLLLRPDYTAGAVRFRRNATLTKTPQT